MGHPDKQEHDFLLFFLIFSKNSLQPIQWQSPRFVGAFPAIASNSEQLTAPVNGTLDSLAQSNAEPGNPTWALEWLDFASESDVNLGLSNHWLAYLQLIYI